MWCAHFNKNTYIIDHIISQRATVFPWTVPGNALALPLYAMWLQNWDDLAKTSSDSKVSNAIPELCYKWTTAYFLLPSVVNLPLNNINGVAQGPVLGPLITGQRG